MYEDYYGFVQSPFTLAPDARFFYLSESHQDALKRLLHAIRRKEGFIVLTGDIGTGKTTLCRALLEQLDPATFTSLVLNPFLSVEELLRDVLVDFGVVSRETVRNGRASSATKHELASTLHDFLRSLAPIQGSGLLIVDEAQHLSPRVLEELRVLANLDTGASRLQIVLVGQSALLDVLGEASMRQLDQRISLRATLQPLSRVEVDAYIAHRLSVARGSSSVDFAPKAVERVQALSGGVPRVVNLLCDRALMLGADAGLWTITDDVVRKASAALALTPGVVQPSWRRRERWIVALAAVLLLTALLLYAAATF